jgi:hypothetical protein
MLGIDGSYNLSYILGCALVLLLIVSCAQRVFYDLYRHPLSHIPGPKLAAVTYLYQTYYSLVGGSRFYAQISKRHEKYGRTRKGILCGVFPNEFALQ